MSRSATIMTIAMISLGFAAATSLTAAPALGAEPVRPWSGPRAKVTTAHLKPAMKGNEDYWEKYTFDADFGERGSMYFSMGIANLGSGDHKLDARGRLTIDGRSFKWKKEYDDDEWRNEKQGFRIRAGKASMSGTPERLVFENERGGDAFEITFTPIARAWRPKSGRIQYGKDRLAMDVTLFPLMKVEGRYKQDGGEWQTIEGRGWGSHNWSELMMYNQARWTVDFRGIEGDYAVWMREFSTTDDYGRLRIPYLLITKGNEILVESYDYTFIAKDVFTDSKHDNKYKVPESFQLVGTDAEDKSRQFRASAKKSKLRERKDYLKDMGTMKAVLVGRFSEPVRYDYDMSYTFEVKTKDGVDRFEGIGRYEFNHLNK